MVKRFHGSRRLSLRTTAAVGIAAVVLGLLGGAFASDAASDPAGSVIVVSERACATGGSGPVAGRQVLRLRDEARDPLELYLIQPSDNAVYAELQNFTPGTTRTLSTTLTAGRYAFRCVFSDGTVLTSAAHTVTGTVSGAVPGVQPMPDLALGAPVAAYRRYVEHALPLLLADSRTLDADLAAGDLARARTDWLTAHLDYERLGAAYNTFQDFDGLINGTADGLPLGTADPSWTGFFRIEFGLWHGQSAAELRPLTAGLVKNVQGLIADFPSEDTDPGDLALRSHEILENALEFQLSGADDYGSGTTLATVYANTQGTQAVLATVTALITPRDPALLASIDRWTAAVQHDLLGARAADGRWTPVAQLPRAQRQRLDGDLGALLEQLSSVPDLLTGRTSA
ncbi:EfeM/EfeO family lipoprotein [Streptacidiphilus sp. PB12-B1b]|uniref:EfeM/EfeO family lipoprotein n=1 Tax=Streptacidiphilus sp. PB12-B1b TaxID=2705012 RepID=UPI0015FC23B9|nr:EfeM/EfeO family lipoprotein [Streptacidiphilus sp. PB12-B1b]QMU77594.1 EfeM/EfeO family lipoprotein [Streptacidiphilus sp. PB12-B1b]